MKQHIKHILNEARVQRTIDQRIWASMSSMTSRLRSTLGEDAKPMKKDDMNTLLQKYVAGLLTMKVACPNNVSEITDNKAYKQIGLAYINAGGTISDIKRLYAENGGKVEDVPEEPASVVGNKDYDDVIDDVDDTVTDDAWDNDPIDNVEEPPVDNIDDEHIDTVEDNFDDSDEDILDKYPYEEEKPVKQIDNIQQYINTYLKRNAAIQGANRGDKLAFDDTTNDFNVISPKMNSEVLPISTGRAFTNIDKKTRFFVVDDTVYNAGTQGNNGVYDDYYFKKEMKRGRLAIVPGSNYYADEVIKGKFYTEILADNGFIPAVKVKDALDKTDITDAAALQVLKVSAYIPTLPELCGIIDMLEPGVYWTSSVAKDGTSNIALSVSPDKLLANTDKAKLVAFIRFD